MVSFHYTCTHVFIRENAFKKSLCELCTNHIFLCINCYSVCRTANGMRQYSTLWRHGKAFTMPRHHLHNASKPAIKQQWKPIHYRSLFRGVFKASCVNEALATKTICSALKKNGMLLPRVFLLLLVQTEDSKAHINSYFTHRRFLLKKKVDILPCKQAQYTDICF